MELVFIQLPAPRPAPAVAVNQQKAGPSPPTTARLKLRQVAAVTTHPASDSSSARPLQMTTADDQWSSTPETASKNDGISFERNKLTTHFNPIRASTPTRLHLRVQYSPRDVLRAVSKELFWPPGYTDDPCPGFAKAVEILSAGSTAREYALLEDAVLQQGTYCN